VSIAQPLVLIRILLRFLGFGVCLNELGIYEQYMVKGAK
jgi:hypothetical protein